MDTEEIKQYLETELPDFKYKTDGENNPNKVWIEREGSSKEADLERKKELNKYLASVGMGLRHKQVRGV